jgi:hypothetical protein
MFKNTRRGSDTYSARIQFNKNLTLSNETYYDVQLDYLINIDENQCDNDTVLLRIVLYDENLFEELLFESNETFFEKNKWNRINKCFIVLARQYNLNIDAINNCNNNNTFIAVDNLIIKELDEINVKEKQCLDLEITYEPNKITETYEKITEYLSRETSLEVRTTFEDNIDQTVSLNGINNIQSTSEKTRAVSLHLSYVNTKDRSF